MVARIKDRQDFELKAFDVKDGKLAHAMKVERRPGELGEHGRASATAQNGKPGAAREERAEDGGEEVADETGNSKLETGEEPARLAFRRDTRRLYILLFCPRHVAA